jgi:glycosyltransferase involved in cell wall biosynthesis
MVQQKLLYCMVVHAHYPIGEPRVEREADALSSHGYQVEVLCLRHHNEPATETIDGISIHRLPVQRNKKFGVIMQFFEYLAFFGLVFIRLARSTQRYQVVHVHNLPDFLVFAAIFPRLRGARIVLDLHDLMPEFYLSRFNRPYSHWLVWLVGLQEKLACRFAHHVITVSEPWRQTLIKRGVPPEKCSVIMNVAGARFKQGFDCWPRPALTDNDFRLVYHGTLAYRYGIDLILQAVAMVRNELPRLHLTIHGRGEYLEALYALAEQLNLQDTVTFSTQYVPMHELPRLVASAHVGLVAYRRDVFTDGILPTKLMEYVALGVPAIVARTPTIEAYFDETMVEFFTPENVTELAGRIRYLYHHRNRLAELATNANRFNQLYDWSKQSAQLVNLADRLRQSSLSMQKTNEGNTPNFR